MTKWTVQLVAKALLRVDNIHGNISLHTAGGLHRLANGDESNCIIFDNAGGRLFDVWMGEDVSDEMLQTISSEHLHVARVDGIDNIAHVPMPSAEQQFIHWVPIPPEPDDVLD